MKRVDGSRLSFGLWVVLGGAGLMIASSAVRGVLGAIDVTSAIWAGRARQVTGGGQPKTSARRNRARRMTP